MFPLGVQADMAASSIVPLDQDDPTIADRLILRAMIEDGLPSRAAQENWPAHQPWEFARAIFDCVYRCPYEQKLAESVFENITCGRLKTALRLGIDIQNRGLPALEPLLAESAAMRQSD
jgi:hypothetical protein